jgi:hypothetical protein
MPFPVVSQQHLAARLSKSAVKDASVHHHPHALTQLTPEDININRAITAKKCESSRNWPSFPCSMWFETSAKVNVFCINCNFKDERDWQGRIIGRGVHGLLNALLARIKHKDKDTPLIGLLTICIDCCEEGLKFDYRDYKAEIDQILCSKNKNKRFGSILLGLSYKEVEGVIFSKVIIMEGILMSTIETIGVDAKQEKWDLLKPIFKN